MTDRFYMPEWQDAQRQLGYAQAVRHGDMLRIAGTASMGEGFMPLHAGDFEAQLRHVYGAIATTLDHFGLGFDAIVRETIYVTDMDALAAALPLRRSFYGDGPFPAATAVEVRRLLLPELLVEIEVDAALPA
ncbi:RidA family protein [Rhizorhabdus histidinilytica]|uniref:Enamine deaminase RidA, house cleaning of reactive enamine intermediates, YjgF/YER057c/UK114 family n=1 Tax=Rhizorhabdus histidinilytica TaxID=439228 RepID=A0A1T5GA55_9SPHN|nr:RidA family protein [Rhizorhabdus histidinilytica]SKC05286.1 Enamine deaminase RidA, house cleaning of reactive enamine intermediates, YjgF/YER057c/UK114 family [Rhizorhabdus histidinilytica]